MSSFISYRIMAQDQAIWDLRFTPISFVYLCSSQQIVLSLFRAGKHIEMELEGSGLDDTRMSQMGPVIGRDANIYAPMRMFRIRDCELRVHSYRTI
jgi:hypothetical protein